VNSGEIQIKLAKYCFCTLEKSQKLHSGEKPNKYRLASTRQILLLHSGEKPKTARKRKAKEMPLAKYTRKGTQLCCVAAALLYKGKTFFTNPAASKKRFYKSQIAQLRKSVSLYVSVLL